MKSVDIVKNIKKKMLKNRQIRKAENPDLIDATNSILAACSVRAGVAPTKYLRRISLTHGVLHTVRFGIRMLNNKAPTWTGDNEVLQSIDKMSYDVAHTVLTEVLSETSTGDRFFKDFFSLQDGLLTYRTDLRFTAPMSKNTIVPFGPDFPDFTGELDQDILNQIHEDIYEISGICGTVSLEKIALEKRNDVGLQNQIRLLTIFMALGKCVLSNWTAEQRAFLDMFACMEVDYNFDHDFDHDEHDQHDNHDQHDQHDKSSRPRRSRKLMML